MKKYEDRTKGILFVDYAITYLAVWPLLASGLIKITSLLSQSRLMLVTDPILMVTNKTIYAGVGGMEVVTSAAVLLVAGKLRKKQILIGILAGGMAWYRLMQKWLNVSDPCPCLGSFGATLPIPYWMLDRILIGLVICWIIIGAWGLSMSIYRLITNKVAKQQNSSDSK